MRWRGSRRAIFIAILALALCAAVATAKGPRTRLASQTSTGEPAANTTDGTAISGNGRRAAFHSNASNLPGANGKTQLYVYDLGTHKLKLASKDADGNPADQTSSDPWLSGSGRLAAFSSTATNLPSGDGATLLIYVRDLRQEVTELASVNSEGDPVDDSATSPSLSASGRFVGFGTGAENLPGSSEIELGAYVYDRRKEKTVLASRANDEAPVTSDGDGVVPADGEHVTFTSNDMGLPAGDGTTERVYVRDLAKGTTKLVSQTSQEDANDGDCGYAMPSADGSEVAFTCAADNLPGGGGMTSQVYVRDIDAGTTRLASGTGNGNPGDENSYDPSMSANGKAVSFYTNSDNLPGRDNTEDVYVYSVGSGKLTVVSRNSKGKFAKDDSEAYPPALSGDGSSAVFRTNAENLPGTEGLYTQLFVRGPLR